MLEAGNIWYKAGNKVLLENVSAAFDPGKLHMIIGPNGAGKSTFIKVLCGQLQPNEGTVSYEGINASKLGAAALAKIRAVLSQNIDIAFPMKVWEVVMMGRYPHFSGKPGSKDEAACEEAMRFFNVLDLADRDYLTLSGGEKQRVHFARVIAQVWYPADTGCRYLILDEPLTFLDVKYQFQFMNKLRELLQNKDMVVVGVVHDLNLAAKFADTITLIDKGTIAASGTRGQVLTRGHIGRVYNLEPVIVEDKSKGTFYLFFD